MSQTLLSSVPGIYEALLGLVQQAAADLNPAPAVFPFKLAEYEPGSYVILHKIVGPAYEWADIGTFTQEEHYEIHGFTTVFVGDSMTNDATVQTDVLTQTLNLFQQCVMRPIMSNRTMPLLGTAGPSPYLMLPERMGYDCGPGDISGGQGGWFGRYDFSFLFKARVTPA